MGETLYHYTKLNTFIEFILPTMELQFTKIKDSRDPYENKKFVSISEDNNKVPEEKREKYTKLFEKVRNVQILCFCFSMKSEFEAGYNSRMWNQYAEDHRGVCIGIDKNIFEKELQKINNNIFKDDCLKQVWYHKPYNGRSSVFFDSQKEIETNLLNNKENLLLTKFNDYKEESEMRALYYSNESEELLKINIEESIKTITLGDNMPEIYKKMIRKYLEREKIDCEVTGISFPSLFDIKPS